MIVSRLPFPAAIPGSVAGSAAVRGKPDNVVLPFCLLFTPLILLASLLWPYQRYNPYATALFAVLCYNLGLIACSRATGKNPVFVLSMFTLKFLSAYLILWFGWFETNDWDRSVVYRSFDPATYDAFAAWVVEAGEPLHNFMNVEDMSNYPYTINLYATLYTYLGSSVLNGGSFNSLLVGLSYYFFYRVARRLGAKENVSLYLVWMFVIPEIVYFTALPGKEASSLAVAGATTFFVFEWRRLKDLWQPEFLVALVVIALLTGVRKHIFAGAFATSLIIRLIFLFQVKRPILMASTVFFLIVLAGALLSTNIFGKQVTEFFGGGLVFKEELVERTIDVLEQREEVMFSSRSITRRFIPYTVMQALLYLPIRTGFYFIAPFPPKFQEWKNDAIGDWMAQGYVTSFFAFFGLGAFGLMLSTLFGYDRHVLGPQVWVPFFWICATLAIVSFSFFAIHERYRLFSIPMWLIAFYFGVRSPYRVLGLSVNVVLVGLGIFAFIILRT